MLSDTQRAPGHPVGSSSRVREAIANLPMIAILIPFWAQVGSEGFFFHRNLLVYSSARLKYQAQTATNDSIDLSRQFFYTLLHNSP